MQRYRIDAIAGISPYNAKISIPQGDKPAKHFDSRVKETKYLTTVIAQPQYFDIFKYDWLAGNAATALNAPFTVVLTESKAHQYFGITPMDKVIGKEVIYDDSLSVHVSGVIKDWDKNTDLSFTDFISFSTIQSSFLKNSFSPGSWGRGDMSTWTFAKLAKGTLTAQVSTQMTLLVKRNADPGAKLTLWLEPLSGIHFNGNVVESNIRTAHLPTLYSLMGIALFILITPPLTLLIYPPHSLFNGPKKLACEKYWAVPGKAWFSVFNRNFSPYSSCYIIGCFTCKSCSFGVSVVYATRYRIPYF